LHNGLNRNDINKYTVSLSVLGAVYILFAACESVYDIILKQVQKYHMFGAGYEGKKQIQEDHLGRPVTGSRYIGGYSILARIDGYALYDTGR
jgi:hypothetical protein